MKNDFSNVYQFKITLNETNPAVWRRIQVPENFSFWDLHVAIQDSMGWTDSHLHDFSVANLVTRERIRFSVPHPDDEVKALDETKQKIADWFGVKFDKCQYTYDFGDGWQHTIEFEKSVPKDEKTKYPICLEGKMACPPEDCGGVWGYEQICNGEYEWQENFKSYKPDRFDSSKVKFADTKMRLKRFLS